MSDTRSIIAASVATLNQAESAGTGDSDTGDSGGDTSTPEATETDTTADADPASGGSERTDPAAPAAGGDGTLPEKTDAAPGGDKKTEDKKVEDNDDFDKEPEFTTDARGKKRVNSIPQPRVKKMVERAIAKAIGEKETEWKGKHETQEGLLRQYDSLGDIMENEPDRFMAMLAGSKNPAYKAYLEAHEAVKSGRAAVAKEGGAADPMPQPDSQLPDGTPAYSPEGFAKVQDWQARQVEKRVLGQVDQKFKWLTDEKNAREAQTASGARIKQQIGTALSNWKGFKENFNAILDELKSDSAKKLTLEDAYRNVIHRNFDTEREKLQKELDALKTDRNKMREEILKELNGRSSTTAAVPASTTTTRPEAKDDAPKDSRSIIAAAVQRLKHQGVR